MQTFAALADPVRAHIVELLGSDDLMIGDIAHHFLISRQAVSRHLAILLEAQLVQVRRETHQPVYSLDPRGFAKVDEWLSRSRHACAHRPAGPLSAQPAALAASS